MNDDTLGELDGLVAAPANHRLLFENDRVRVIETVIRVGERTPLHTHLRPTVSYVLTGSHLVRRDEAGTTVLDTRADPAFVLQQVLFSPPLQRHTLENPGPAELRLIGVELKDAAPD